jgi:hypothetical protein
MIADLPHCGHVGFAEFTSASTIGSSVLETCVTSHAPTSYNPAMRMTLRRLSSASRLMKAASR